MRRRTRRMWAALLAGGLAAALLGVSFSMALLAPVEAAHARHHAPGSPSHPSPRHAGTECCDLCAAHCSPAVPAGLDSVRVVPLAAPRRTAGFAAGTLRAPASLRHRYPPSQAPPALLG